MDSSCLEETQDPNEISSNSPQNIIEHDDASTLKEENNEYSLKPTFKNTLQAKKRLQAFAQQKQILISPKAKMKSAGLNDKFLNIQCESQENAGIKSKKENTIDKAKATVEEIELLKKSELSYKIQNNEAEKVTRRSRSKSSEQNFIFRKRERKVRNYRKSDSTRRSPSPTIITARDKYSRRSPSPTITTARDKYSEKSKVKYPRNWDEFKRDQWTFEKLLCKDSHFKSQSSNTPNDIFRQLLFDSPSDLIKPYHFKNNRGEDVSIPYKFLRFTLTRPRISYNENLTKVKEPYLNRKQVLNRTNKNHKEFLEKFYTRNSKKIKTNEPMGQRNWYLKNWKDSESKALETSIGLSFLLNYSDDEEDDDQLPLDLHEHLEKSAQGKKERNETNLKIEEASKTTNESTKEETEYISFKGVERHKDKKKYSPSRRKDRTKSESTNEDSKIEELKSWTPERKMSLSEDTCKESPKIKGEKEIENEKKLNNKKQDSIVKSIPSDDEWAETPDRKSNIEKENKKKKKKSKHEHKSDSSSSSLDEEKSKKKKRKQARKKKQKEKEKKARKKEKLKAEKLKQKKKQKKKEILKKLKKEFQHNLEKEEKEIEKPVKVKVEKEDKCEDVMPPAEDSKKLISQKEYEEDVPAEKVEISLKVKKEKQLEETVKVNEKIVDEILSSELPVKKTDEEKSRKKAQIEENAAEPTPDTEEYQSNWESDDGVSVVKPGSKRGNRGWESDEEVFERAFSKKKPSDIPFGASPVLEMPLDIKFTKRSYNKHEKKRSRTRSPEYLDMRKEIELLEAERINLNKQRMQLEMEKIRIHELERKKSIEEMEYRDRHESSPIWLENRNRWPDDIHSSPRERRLMEEHHSKNSDKADETATSSINISKSSSENIMVIHSSPEISSTKSPTHTILESAYQEFMRAVSGGDKTGDIVISSSESEVPCQKSSRTKSVISKSRRDRNRRRHEEVEQPKILATTDPKILQEILLPGEIPMPEVPTVPAPVPSPKLDLSQGTMPVVMKATAQIALEQAPAIKTKEIEQPEDNQQPSPINQSQKKPFTFSSLIIQKKSLLLERSNWKLDNDSDEELPPKSNIVQNNQLEESIPEKAAIDPLIKKEVIEKEEPEITEEKITDKKVRDREKDTEGRRESESSFKRKQSRSRSPSNTSRDKRRKEDDGKKRDDEKRRDSSTRRVDEHRKKEEEPKRSSRSRNYSSPSRHRGSSPRRRRYSSPIHKKSSPKHRSPPRRNARRPERSDRRSPPTSGKRRRSYSPARTSPSSRRRSPSPRESSQYGRMSKSPRLSPMEGLKRSVADSTISDDLLPQHYAVDSSSSPLCSSTPAPSSRRQRLALSPKRPSLDERINQVLGIENEPQHHQPVSKHTESLDPRQNSLYSNYQHQHHHDMSTDLGSFPSMPAKTSSKNLQVGNIIQVVPCEDFGLPPPQPVAPPSQMILQVGNMLQIVPSEMEPVTPPPLLSEPPKGSPLLVEKSMAPNVTPQERSAENVLDDRLADRLKKRKEKEERKKEKERKKKERVKKKKMRLKVSTEEMIKRALELDGYIGLENEDLNAMIPEVISSTPGLDPSRSILSSSTSRFLDSSLKTERERKSVQFADGIRPGEGTSPSGGEELSSPPPQSEALMKPKKHKKSVKKKKKKKVKVKVKKRRTFPVSPTESEEEYENLPPPSPPPGSPPPHVFPPRAKVHTINNIPQHYLPSYGITTAPQTPPVVHSQSRMNPAYQTPPTAIYRTPPPHVNVIGQHYPRLNHVPPMGMNIPPPTSALHRDQQTYGSY
ncbi:daf-12-interacting protein 1-like isoform X2 [Harmonia axyridis]|uniref:daf-12-interacting protein 1-like isoform X2 n=1 Tax=Harmonia axyridis TaxID=115357 RepID=UPI001E277B37|nr:daf-12-interacting protein 1-like isoform X2 [Harmonia axyridis]